MDSFIRRLGIGNSVYAPYFYMPEIWRFLPIKMQDAAALSGSGMDENPIASFSRNDYFLIK